MELCHHLDIFKKLAVVEKQNNMPINIDTHTMKTKISGDTIKPPHSS